MEGDGIAKGKPKSSWRWLRRGLALLFVLAVPVPVILLLIFRFAPVPGTPQMLLRVLRGEGVNYKWLPPDQLPPILGRAVIGSEDQNFCSHHGFDWKSIDQAVASHERDPGRRLRGASTISQQTARTLFLVPMRSWVRKGMEAYLTVLTEGLWPKQQILTAYLNLVDWGRGNFGAEAASEAYFGKSARLLTPTEAARLAAILPDPDIWNAAQPGPYVAGRTVTLVARAAQVRRDGLDFCVR